MNDDELKKLWREQPLALPPALTESSQLAVLRKKMKKFDRIIWWRDFREVAVCIGVLVWFGFNFFRHPSPLARLGCILTILSSVSIGWRLLWSKKKAGQEVPNASIMGSLRIELRKVETQIRLLRSVLWWYLIPILGGSSVFYFGVNHDAADRMAVLITFVLLSWFLHWLNQRAVRQYLLPLKNDLEFLLGLDPKLDARL